MYFRYILIFVRTSYKEPCIQFSSLLTDKTHIAYMYQRVDLEVSTYNIISLQTTVSTSSLFFV